jgi:hypothetical protein
LAFAAATRGGEVATNANPSIPVEYMEVMK